MTNVLNNAILDNQRFTLNNSGPTQLYINGVFNLLDGTTRLYPAEYVVAPGEHLDVMFQSDSEDVVLTVSASNTSHHETLRLITSSVVDSDGNFVLSDIDALKFQETTAFKSFSLK